MRALSPYVLLLSLCLIACKEDVPPPQPRMDVRPIARGEGSYHWGLIRTDSTTYDIGADSVTVHSGKWAAHMFYLHDTSATGGAGIYHNLDIDLVRMKRIRLTGWSKVENVTMAAVYVRVIKEPGEEKKSLGSEIYEGIADFAGMEEGIPEHFLVHQDDSSNVGTGDWKQHVLEFDVPAEAVTLWFGAYMYGKGKMWIDDFHYEVVKKLPEDTTFKDRSMYIAVPRDLDFEELP